MFVDNQARVVYGQLYVSDYDKDEFTSRFVTDVLMSIHATYQKEVESAMRQKGMFPLAAPTLKKIREIIRLRIEKESPER